MTVPYSFSTATAAIPLSQLDSNFNTAITLGNTAIQLGNTVTTLNNMTLANVTISSGNVTITNVSVTTANVTTVNATTVIATTANVTTANITTGNVTFANITGENVTTSNIATLTVTNNPTFSGGTANGVLYLNGSKVATSGTALTFDGTNLALTGSSPIYKVPTAGGNLFDAGGNNGIYIQGTPSAYLGFYASGSEQMRLTSTGLGIGTTPTSKLDVNVGGTNNIKFGTASNFGIITLNGSVTTSASMGIFGGATGDADLYYQNATGGGHRFRVGTTTMAYLDSSGNLGLGVTPSAWWSGSKAIQVGNGASFEGRTGSNIASMGSNYFLNASGVSTYINSAAATQYYQSSGSHIWQTAASGTAGNAISFTQAMTLDASSNLGLAETNPAAYGGFVSKYAGIGLHANSTSGAAGLNLYENGTGRFSLRTLNGSAGLSFYDTFNGTERVRIDSDGNLLVGTTNASTTAGAGVKIINNSGQPFLSEVNAASTSAVTTFNLYSTGAAAYRFYVGFEGTVYATNTTISAISDQRLKENIQDLDAGLSAVMALKPRKFDWKAGKGKDIKGDRGFIAQEFEQVFPDLIDEWKDPAPEGEEPYKSVRQDLIPVLVKAIQELNAKVEALEAQLKGN